MLVSEALLLLFTRDDGKPERLIGHQEHALKVGLVADLVMHGAVSLSEERTPQIHFMVDPHGDTTLPPLLERAVRQMHGLLQSKERVTLDHFVKDHRYRVREDVAHSLQDAGVLTANTSSFLGIQRRTIEILNPAMEAGLRQKLIAILQGTAQPSAMELVILSILKSIGATRALFQKEIPGYSDRDAKRKIESLEANAEAHVPNNVAKATKRAVDAAQMAIISGVVVAGFQYS